MTPPDAIRVLRFPCFFHVFLHVISFELRCYFTVSQSREKEQGFSSPPRPDPSNAASAISRVFRPRLRHLSPYHTTSYDNIHTVVPYYDASRVPNSLRMVEYHSTPPIPRSFGLLLPGPSYSFLPHTAPSPGCLSFPPLATPSYVIPFWHPLCYSACTPCTRQIFASPLSVSPVPKCLLRPRV